MMLFTLINPVKHRSTVALKLLFVESTINSMNDISFSNEFFKLFICLQTNSLTKYTILH